MSKTSEGLASKSFWLEDSDRIFISRKFFSDAQAASSQVDLELQFHTKVVHRFCASLSLQSDYVLDNSIFGWKLPKSSAIKLKVLLQGKPLTKF